MDTILPNLSDDDTVIFLYSENGKEYLEPNLIIVVLALLHGISAHDAEMPSQMT